MTPRAPSGIQPIVEGVALVAAVTLLAHILAGSLGLANLALFYLLPVMLAAGRSGLRAGLFTAVIATLAFNFFLVPPRLTLHIADPDNLVTMLLLFAVAVAVSQLSARIRAQAALAERLAGDRQRDAFREALLSSISHDLRTPITAIRTGLETLDGPERDRDALAAVKAQTVRLEQMVTNLLDMTRIGAGAAAPRADVIDLTDVVAATIEALPPPQRAAVTVTLPPDLPLVRADPVMLHHMLANLVDNALRHGGGNVTILADQRDGRLRLSVADRGPGLSAGQEVHLFEPFRRGDGAGAEGSGLGLAIVRGFGDAMGLETAGARCSDGPGSVFTIAFPARLLVASTAADGV